MRVVKGPDGLYHVKGKTYKLLIGSRQQVGHETAYKTSGGLTRKHLIQTKDGRWKSLLKHNTSLKEKRLEKAGYFAEKGKFGAVKRTLKHKRIKRL